MTEPDDSQSHVLTPPWQPAFSGTWTGRCSCGEEFAVATAQAVRDAGLPHRLAEIARLRRTPTEMENRGSDVGG